MYSRCPEHVFKVSSACARDVHVFKVSRACVQGV